MQLPASLIKSENILTFFVSLQTDITCTNFFELI